MRGLLFEDSWTLTASNPLRVDAEVLHLGDEGVGTLVDTALAPMYMLVLLRGLGVAVSLPKLSPLKAGLVPVYIGSRHLDVAVIAVGL